MTRVKLAPGQLGEFSRARLDPAGRRRAVVVFSVPGIPPGQGLVQGKKTFRTDVILKPVPCVAASGKFGLARAVARS